MDTCEQGKFLIRRKRWLKLRNSLQKTSLNKLWTERVFIDLSLTVVLHFEYLNATNRRNYMQKHYNKLYIAGFIALMGLLTACQTTGGTGGSC